MLWPSWCTQDSRRPQFRIFEPESFTIRCAVPEKPMLEWNITSIGRPITKLWPFLYVQDHLLLPSWILSKVKFNDSGPRGQSAYISLPNLVKIYQRAAELWQFMCFKWRPPPSWIFIEVKFEGISVSGTFVFVSQPNFVLICAIATEYGRRSEFSK